jgi:hypothetical protein
VRPVIPSLSSAVVNADSYTPTSTWAQFFAGLIADPGAIVAVTVGASPFTYTAGDDGFLSIGGGTVSDVTLRRARVSFLTPFTSGFVPMSKGDAVVVTYSVAPTLNFVPR